MPLRNAKRKPKAKGKSKAGGKRPPIGGGRVTIMPIAPRKPILRKRLGRKKK